MDAVADFPTYTQALEALRRVYRRPVNLRQNNVTTSESAVRGAKLMYQLRSDACTIEEALSAFSMLGPKQREQTAALFKRAPAQVLARLDTLVGGSGRPVGAPGPALSHLRALRDPHAHMGLVPAHTFLAIAAPQLFGARSDLIAAIAARLAAMVTGFDPIGLGVPEVYFSRHKREYHDLISAHSSQWPEFYFQACLAGAAEAEGIARMVAEG
ncbi:hypothetical protein N7326_06870 [Corynebacterium sp. ES2794-CONJ1]|uniref:hypothetical protein n=1 Tax=unclassified Corynebacterium TaxID=2624378 RepID=UPI002168D75A|nr:MULTISPECIES: hypothetical protein [unclassified Corynebacterium]MCS4490100.1 hypothetical protein [Corynebacterium sp. ES2775-CONJ]MCS4532199.1 hypothetical protein [Corynebacterium sp. ES2730-CONJ]MCU9519595.1 hypothetical protein [Corynebacterium sp. ES2794-CONJ1]